MPLQGKRQSAIKVLIVEDESLIADTIRYYLERNNLIVTGCAESYREAVELYRSWKPDVVLLDIHLNGAKTGIDFAYFLRRQQEPPPFIYLTPQIGEDSFNLARETFPAGYLTKPIQLESMLTTLRIALFKVRFNFARKNTITLKHQGETTVVQVSSIQFLKAEHIYVRFVLKNGNSVLQRGTLAEMQHRLKDGRFIQVHRGYVVNLDTVTGYNSESLYIGGQEIPVSRSRKAEVLASMEAGK